MSVQCVLFNIHRMFHITNICFYVWMKCLWCSCLCLRVLKEKAWAPSLSRYPAATWSSEQLQNQTVRHKHTEECCVLLQHQSLETLSCVQAAAGWTLLNWLWSARVCWSERWSERAERRRRRPQSTRTSTSTVCWGHTTCRASSKTHINTASCHLTGSSD